jgi:hypothetical protein
MLGEKAHCFHHYRAAFQLDHLRARHHQFLRMGEGFLRADLKGAERHVTEYERLLRTTRHAGGVVNHIVQRNR